MTLSEIAGSKELCEQLVADGKITETVSALLAQTSSENEADEIFNVVKIGNRIVRFGPDYEEPDFDRGKLAASVLELTFSKEKVNDVPFTNAAAYLNNIGEYDEIIKVCLAGLKRFPDNVALMAKAKDAAEMCGDEKTAAVIDGSMKELFDRNPSSLAEETNRLIMNWKSDEAKEMIYNYLDAGKPQVPGLYSNLFFVYNQGFKDDRTESIAAKTVELISSGSDGFARNAELVYNACLYYVQQYKWQEADKMLAAFSSTGTAASYTIAYVSLSVAIMSKDKGKIEQSLGEFHKLYNSDNSFFQNYTAYAFANVSNCYALLGDKQKTSEYLRKAKETGMDIGYVRTMDDYKLMEGDPEFNNLFD